MRVCAARAPRPDTQERAHLYESARPPKEEYVPTWKGMGYSARMKDKESIADERRSSLTPCFHSHPKPRVIVALFGPSLGIFPGTLRKSPSMDGEQRGNAGEILMDRFQAADKEGSRCAFGSINSALEGESLCSTSSSYPPVHLSLKPTRSREHLRVQRRQPLAYRLG